MRAPPEHVILAAEAAAAQPGCMGSRRGVAIFQRSDGFRRDEVIAVGRNSQPAPFVCDGGSPRCREVCGKRCVHAERRALDQLMSMIEGSVPAFGVDPADCDLVHVKIGSDGRVIAGGGPSCWQCSREILDAGIGGVWLYENRVSNVVGPGIGTAAAITMGTWIRYTAEGFHRVTLCNCGLEVP